MSMSYEIARRDEEIRALRVALEALGHDVGVSRAWGQRIAELTDSYNNLYKEKEELEAQLREEIKELRDTISSLKSTYLVDLEKNVSSRLSNVGPGQRPDDSDLERVLRVIAALANVYASDY